MGSFQPGYALLLGAMIAVLALYRFRRRQREPAGREAEALLLGPERVSTGASNDIEKAALIAQRMVCEWGMLPLSDEVCLFSQQQKDQAAQQWLSQGRLLAAGTLRAHQAAWERLTRLLMERESVDGEEVARCLEA